MEEVVERGNVLAALRRVRANRGSAGIDGMTVEELRDHLVGNWPEIRASLLEGTYEPQAVKRVEIPKPGGGTRMLGIPTVVDRLVQQGILQVLQKRFDPTFSESSYGFRPGRRAHDAVCAAQRYIQSGRRWVVDVDLEKFFDRVNHDVLMGRLEKRIADKRMLTIIRRFLSAGMLAEGVVVERHEGTPQGGPLSPLLANVLLDEVDKELEKRGHTFARYADDLNVYVSSKRAGEDVMELLRRLFVELRLKVNEAKSAVARPWARKFLGYSFWVAPRGEIRRKVAPKAIEKMKGRAREITVPGGRFAFRDVVAQLTDYLRGWKNYFRLAETPGVFDDLDKWLRRRLRALILRRWRQFHVVKRELRKRGIAERSAVAVAMHVARWWRSASHPAMMTAFPVTYFDRLGVPRLA
jgi:RNA-directed DNA polymerase